MNEEDVKIAAIGFTAIVDQLITQRMGKFICDNVIQQDSVIKVAISNSINRYLDENKSIMDGIIGQMPIPTSDEIQERVDDHIAELKIENMSTDSIDAAIREIDIPNLIDTAICDELKHNNIEDTIEEKVGDQIKEVIDERLQEHPEIIDDSIEVILSKMNIRDIVKEVISEHFKLEKEEMKKSSEEQLKTSEVMPLNLVVRNDLAQSLNHILSNVQGITVQTIA